jgi:hypothetical protein
MAAGGMATGGMAAPARQTADQAEPLDESASLRPARGVAYGLLISVPFWILLAVLSWLAF